MRWINPVLGLLVLALPLSAGLSFNSGNLGTIGVGNTIFLFTPSGGSGPYAFSYTPSTTPIPNFRVINGPELPSYANASQTGGLAGIPLSAGVQSASIRLTDLATNQFIDQTVSFTVVTIDLIGFMPNYYSIGDTVSQKFWPTGGTPPYSYTQTGTLPPGLSLSTQSINGQNVAVISGMIGNTATTATTTASNGYSFGITIKDSANNSLNRGFFMAVSAMQLSINGVPLNSGGDRNLPNATVGLAYNEPITVTGGTPPYTFGLQPLNAPPSPLILSPIGSPTISASISGTPTGSNFGGRFTITVTDSANHYLDARLALKILPTIPVPLGFSTPTLPDSWLGSNNTNGVYAVGGLPPYTFDVEPSGPLPAGAVLVQGPEVSPEWDPDPGYLRLKVQTPGTYSFTLGVTDSAGNKATHTFSMKVPIMTAEYVYASNVPSAGSPLADLTLGTPYTRYLIPLGGTPPYTVTPTNIPFGLSIDNTDKLSGTPQEAGINLPLNYILTDSINNTFDAPGNITIASTTSPGLTLSGGDFGYVQMGSQYALNLAATGSLQNPPAFSVTQTAGTVPPGLRLLTGTDFNNQGNNTIAAQLAGIPNTPGVYTFVYRVVDGLGQVGQREVKLHVSGLSIVNTALPPGTVNVPYSQTLDIRGGTPPYTISIASGNLPSGLTFDSTGATCGTPLTICGTPTSTNSSGITIQVQDQAGDTLQRGYTLNIYPIQLTGASVLPNATFGQAYSYTFVPNPAGSYTFTASGIPGGLSLNSNTGVLSGTMTATGTFNIAVTAYNNATGAVVVRSYTLFSTTLSAVPFIGGLPSFVFGGMTTPYLADVVVGTNTVLTLGVGSGGVPPYTISLVPPSVLPPGLALSIGSNYQGTTNFGRWAIVGTPTTPGSYTFTLRYADSSGITEDRQVALNVSPLGLATATPAAGIVNQTYSAQLYGTGGNGTYTFALVTESYLQQNLMPPGLTLSPSGQITGTPTSTGTFSPFIQITSGASVRLLNLNITINATGTRQITVNGLPLVLSPASTGRDLYFVLNPLGGAGTHTWSLVSGTLPPGVQLLSGANLPPDLGYSPPTAILGAVSPTPGTYTFRVRVDDSTGNFGIRDATWEWTAMRTTPINDPFFENTSLAPGQVGMPYSFSVGELNGAAPLVFTQDVGTYLPPGVGFSANGVLSGTPTAAGNFILYFHVTDANGNVRHSSTSMSIYPANKTIGVNVQAGSGTYLPSATVQLPYALSLNQLLSTGYGTAPITWSLYSGTLPPGILIVPGSGTTSATLSGTPTTAGTYNFSLLATDANGNQATVYNLLQIVSALGLSPAGGSLPPAIAGIAYQTSFVASGGTPTYTYSLLFGFSDIPPGLSLSPSGVLSGTPTTAGPFVLYVAATDSAPTSNTFVQIYYLNVSPVGTSMPALTLTPSSISIGYTIGDPVPAPIPVSIGSTSTPVAYSVTTSGGSWLSSTSGGGNTPGSTNLNINPVSPVALGAGTYTGTATFTSAGASNSPATIPITMVVSSAVVCTYTISPSTDTILNTGGTKTFNVTVPSASCPWSVDASSLPGWVTIAASSGSSGVGNGSVTLNVAANTVSPPTTERTAQITVNGSSYSLTQFGTSCQFTLQPSALSITAAGGGGTVGVIASSPGCAWSASPNPLYPWISFSGSTSGTGSGSVNVVVAANTNAASQSGSVTIANQAFTVNESGLNCTFSLTAATASIAYSGGPASFGVTAPSGCAWAVNAGPSWISVTSPTPPSGSGNGTVNLAIAANSTTSSRQANVLVGGQTFQVTQASVPCNFSLSANNPVQPAIGGSGSVDITTNAACSWTASSSTGFLSPAVTTGTGSTTLAFTVAANSTGNPRSATLTIAGQNITVNQSGPACTYSLQSTSANVPGSGGSGSVGVLTANGCGPWTAVSNAPSWLHITSTGPYTGPVSASYSIDPNLTGTPQFGTLTIAGQTFSVTEPALPCPVALGTSSQSFGEFGGTSGLFTFTTTPAGCAVNIQSNTSWITLTDLSVPGTVKFSVAPNTYGAARSGAIMVGSQTFTVLEAPSTCAYTPTSFAGPGFGRLGGAAGVPINYSPAQCGVPAVLVNGPAGMVTLGPITSAPGVYTQSYTVSIYQSFINYVRTAQLLIQGQIYTVKQTSW